VASAEYLNGWRLANVIVDRIAGLLGLEVDRAVVGDVVLIPSALALMVLLALSLRSARLFGKGSTALVIVGGLGKLGLVVAASLLVAHPYVERIEYFEVPSVNANATKLTVLLDVSHSMRSSLDKAVKFIDGIVRTTGVEVEVIPWADYPLINETVLLTPSNSTKFHVNRTRPYTSLGNALLYILSMNLSKAVVVTDGGDNGLISPRKVAELLCAEGFKVLVVHVPSPEYSWSEGYLKSLGTCIKYVKLVDVEDPLILSKLVEYSVSSLYGFAKVPMGVKDYEQAYRRILPMLLAFLIIGVGL